MCTSTYHTVLIKVYGCCNKLPRKKFLKSIKRKYHLTFNSAKSSAISHAGLSCPVSVAALMRADKGLAKYVFCFTQRRVFWALLFCHVFNILGVTWSKSEGGGATILLQQRFLLSSEANWQDTVVISSEKGTMCNKIMTENWLLQIIWLMISLLQYFSECRYFQPMVL